MLNQKIIAEIIIADIFLTNTKISSAHRVKGTNYEGDPQFIIENIYSLVVDIK